MDNLKTIITMLIKAEHQAFGEKKGIGKSAINILEMIATGFILPAAGAPMAELLATTTDDSVSMYHNLYTSTQISVLTALLYVYTEILEDRNSDLDPEYVTAFLQEEAE